MRNATLKKRTILAEKYVIALVHEPGRVRINGEREKEREIWCVDCAVHVDKKKKEKKREKRKATKDRYE